MSETKEILDKVEAHGGPRAFFVVLLVAGLLATIVFVILTVLGVELNALWLTPVLLLASGGVGMVITKSGKREDFDTFEARLETVESRLDALDGMDDEARYGALLPYFDRFMSERTASDEDLDAAFAVANADTLLKELVAIDDAEERSKRVRAKVAAENGNKTELKLAALERYGCVRIGHKGATRQLGGDWIDITRADYPKVGERRAMDAKASNG